MELMVENMSCGHCVRAVTDAMHALNPAAEVRVDLARKSLSINGQIDAPAALTALAEAGYPARLISE